LDKGCPVNADKARRERSELQERRFEEWAERTRSKGWFSFWTRPLELLPGENAIMQEGAINDHAWHRSYGSLCMTDRRLIFRGAFAPFSMAPLGHWHIWQLADIEGAGESRHLASLFAMKNLYVQVGGTLHYFVTDKRAEWIDRLTKAASRRE
jgi:hypothetical protein